jgi:hypothetical protein
MVRRNRARKYGRETPARRTISSKEKKIDDEFIVEKEVRTTL